jgi:hypothetical protein
MTALAQCKKWKLTPTSTTEIILKFNRLIT